MYGQTAADTGAAVTSASGSPGLGVLPYKTSFGELLLLELAWPTSTNCASSQLIIRASIISCHWLCFSVLGDRFREIDSIIPVELDLTPLAMHCHLIGGTVCSKEFG